MIFFGFLGLAACCGAAAETTPPRWEGKDAGGQAVTIGGASGRAFVIVFVQPGQTQSDGAMAEVVRAADAMGEVGMAAVVSGREAAARAKDIGPGWKRTIAADEDFACSGCFDVHAWPTCLVLDGRGNVVGRLPGFPLSFRRNLEAYLAAASGKIHDAELKRRLEEQRVVQSGADEKAWGHLLMAERFLAGRQGELAEMQVARAKELAPAGADVRLRLARLLLTVGNKEHSREADDLLRTIEPTAVTSPDELLLLRGWSAQTCGRAAEAKELLGRAIVENSDPVEARYRLAMVYQQEENWGRAAELFRQAYEARVQRNSAATSRPRVKE